MTFAGAFGMVNVAWTGGVGGGGSDLHPIPTATAVSAHRVSGRKREISFAAR